MKTGIILKEIKSAGKGKTIYANRLDKVKVIDFRLPAIIVEDKHGKRFAVHQSEIKINE